MRKCAQVYCRREARKGKRLCTTCDKRKWRQKYPMKAAFQTLRQNARRRGKKFTITFEDFQQFAYEYDFLPGTGRRKKSWTVDRHKNELGYVKGNLRKLTKQDNSRKATKSLHYDYRHPEHTTVA